MTISAWLEQATNQLAGNLFDSSRLDAEIILSHTIKHPRTHLHAHPDDEIDLRQQEIANARLDLRLDHVPIAYIIGHKEFYGRRFQVSPAVLVPRPESEQLIELLNQILPTTAALPGASLKRLVDIGSGSGCLGITAKLEHPELQVTLLDTSRPALNVATKNARALIADVELLQSDLLESYPYSPDIVLANLPYVDRSWERSLDTQHEPEVALFAADDGLSLINTCLDQLSRRMPAGGHVILEADPRQWPAIIQTAKQAGFTLQTQLDFAALFTKN